ncbi:hypothetical protein [Arthrobacter sp. NPDC057013]|uniref:hypothetical protein n=1 Tax=Arthrobacter sp. NPDC057013 TaxID=3345999 RepID=UPI00363DB552
MTANMSASSMIQLAKKLLIESDTTSAEKRPILWPRSQPQCELPVEHGNKILHVTVGGLLVEGVSTSETSKKEIYFRAASRTAGSRSA